MSVRLIITGQPLTNSLKREPELGGGEEDRVKKQGSCCGESIWTDDVLLDRQLRQHLRLQIRDDDHAVYRIYSNIYATYLCIQYYCTLVYIY